jgi:hypothetical protein
MRVRDVRHPEVGPRERSGLGRIRRKRATADATENPIAKAANRGAKRTCGLARSQATALAKIANKTYVDR